MQLIILSALLFSVAIAYPAASPQYEQPRPDGARCPNVSCSPPLPGAQCTPSYERDDGCCPVWYCNHNGASSTIYGKSTGMHTSASFTSSSSHSSPPGNFGQFPAIPLPNFANLFG